MTLGDQLGRAETRADMAALWARLIETTVAVDVGPPVAGRGLPVATAGFATGDGAGRLAVDLGVLRAGIAPLTGHAVDGPVPLSPAEEGAFAYLAARWLERLPDACLTWVHGGEPTWPVPAHGTGPISWRVRIGDHLGVAQWWLPAPAPVRLEVRALVRCVRPLRVGAYVPLHTQLAAFGDERRLGPVAWQDGALRIVAPRPPTASPSLEPLTETIASLGAVEVERDRVAGLSVGDALPMGVEDPPVVRLVQGAHAVGVGCLAWVDGQPAIQITRT